MRGDARFWRNVAIVGVLHVIALVALARWSGTAKKPIMSGIIWMNTGVTPAANSAVMQASYVPEPAATPTEPLEEEPARDQPADFVAPSPIATPSPSPKPTVSATATPRPKPTPKKTLLAKASTPAAKKQHTSEAKKITVKPTKESGSAPNESNATSGSGGSSALAEAKLATYGRMLHDRFYREWVQPTGLPAGAHYTLSARLRIERDGRITEFKLARSSGNIVIDESVEAAGKRVPQVDPPPRELAGAGRYELNVNFELDAE